LAEYTSKWKPRHKGYKKIEFTCKQAAKDGVEYVWVDTCCIDKSSSAELSESINSMYRWYQNSKYCYVYLSDVNKSDFQMEFPKSRWFTRGWTLQELIAPPEVSFFDKSWEFLGTRTTLGEETSSISGIPNSVLQKVQPIDEYSVAEKMFWASSRDTTRKEDSAYCLLGIFDINMPLLYGEGSKAFTRLQEEIIKKTPDDSILAWNMHPQIQKISAVREKIYFNCSGEILAKSPRNFKQCGGIGRGTRSGLSITNRRIDICFPVVELKTSIIAARDTRIGLLSCQPSDRIGVVGIPLWLDPMNKEQFNRVGYRYSPPGEESQTISTIIIDPRAASDAVSRNSTLVDNESLDSYKKKRMEDATTIIINCSSQITSRGFEIQTALQPISNHYDKEVRKVDKKNWNREFETFSFPFGLLSSHLVCNFRSELHDVGFSLIVSSRFDPEENCVLFLGECIDSTRTNQDIAWLVEELSLDSESRLSIWGCYEQLHITARATETIIYGRQHLTIDIDLLEDGVSGITESRP
jgi:hypothetical protein